jgi:hypothetical protein
MLDTPPVAKRPFDRAASPSGTRLDRPRRSPPPIDYEKLLTNAKQRNRVFVEHLNISNPSKF